MEPDPGLMTEFARDLIARKEFDLVHAALDALPVKEGVFLAVGALANQLMRVPPELRRDAATEVASALDEAIPRRPDAEVEKMSTEYRTEINFAAAYMRSRVDQAANPAIVVTALSHVLGQSVLQIPGERITEDQRIQLVCDEVCTGAETWSVMTHSQRAAANRSRHDA